MKKINKINYVIISLISILCLLCQAKAAEAKAAESSVNAVTFATQQGDWLYIKNSEGYLCRVKTDGSKFKKLTDVSLEGSSFILYKNYVFYRYSKETSGYIYRMKTDGSEKKKIANVSAYGDMYGIINDYLYYGGQESGVLGNDSGIPTWRIKLDGSNKKEMGFMIGNRYKTVLSDNFIHSINIYSDELEAMNVSTGKKYNLFGLDSAFSAFKLKGGKVYYSKDVGKYVEGDFQRQYSVLGTIEKDGKGNKVLLKASPEDKMKLIDILGSWIYYMRGKDDNFQVYRVKTDGSGNIKLTDEELSKDTKVIIASKKIIYTTKGNNMELWSRNLDGTGKARIAGFIENTNSGSYNNNYGFAFWDDGWKYEAVGDWIYLYNNGAIYRASLSKKIRQLVTENNLTNKVIEPKSPYSSFLNTFDEYEDLELQYVTKYAFIDIDQNKSNELILFDESHQKIYLFQYKDKKVSYLMYDYYGQSGSFLQYNKTEKCIVLQTYGADGGFTCELIGIKDGELEKHQFHYYNGAVMVSGNYDDKTITLEEFNKLKEKYVEHSKDIMFKKMGK